MFIMNNVIFVIQSMSNAGGCERVVSTLANHWVKIGWSIKIIQCQKGDSFFSLNKRVDLISIDCNSKINKLLHLRALIKKNKNYKVIIVTMRYFSIFSILSLIGFRSRLYVSEHTNINFTNKYITRLKLTLYNLFVKKVIYLTESDCIKSNLPNASYIYNPSLFYNSKLKVNYDSIYALAIGRLDENKNFSRLIKIWKGVVEHDENKKLIIVGEGELKNKLIKLIFDLNLTDSVFILNSTEDILNIYRKAAMVCLTSKNEGLPMVLIEAACLGIPAISFDIETGPNEIIINSKTGFVVKSESEFIDKVLMVFSNDSLRKELSKESMIMSKRFSLNEITSKWNRLL